ncbi:carbohydrate ABC transporter permease [Paenibacillus validus]|uniref:ABC transporter permease subunit n=1 Tax=Paenibacillus validus TaxID=44253 RepID=A0A7X2ZFM2_9BACL|nr:MULTISPECIES: carbohydrate ABC transporter permease [Paenibacillus]MED4602116.1 carbohydrate ABC transporter permease [Paenibacillus validus]MED4607417.1 carbohydrate ABC transporter permease [Paenibacillus validus]MUG73969.1 ABC transporter permease subunit [Paenibacillus validus]
MNQINQETVAGGLLKRIVLLLGALLIIVPVSIVVLASFKTTAELFQKPLGLPSGLNLDNYISMFREQAIGQYFMNSVVVTLVTIFLILLFSSLLSYAIYRFTGWVGLVLYGLFAAGMMVPPQVNMIPIYSLVSKLGLTNSITGLIAVSTSVFMPVAVFILSGFMKTLPKEMIESGSIDGANEWKMYTRIVLPITLPSLSASAIFLSVMIWNDLLYPLLFINSNAKKTLPLALLQFQGEYLTNYPMIFAGVVIASAPMVIAYVFLQRFFVEGVTAGSVKG